MTSCYCTKVLNSYVEQDYLEETSTGCTLSSLEACDDESTNIRFEFESLETQSSLPTIAESQFKFESQLPSETNPFYLHHTENLNSLISGEANYDKLFQYPHHRLQSSVVPPTIPPDPNLTPRLPVELPDNHSPTLPDNHSPTLDSRVDSNPEYFYFVAINGCLELLSIAAQILIDWYKYGRVDMNMLLERIDKSGLKVFEASMQQYLTSLSDNFIKAHVPRLLQPVIDISFVCSLTRISYKLINKEKNAEKQLANFIIAEVCAAKFGTFVGTSLGTCVGGPLGGIIGSFIGSCVFQCVATEAINRLFPKSS